MTRKPLLVFYGFWYLIPGVFSLIYPEFITESFNGGVSLLSIIYTVIFFLASYYFSKVEIDFLDFKQSKYLGYLFNEKVEWVFLLTFFYTSYIFFSQYGIEFRHTGEGLSAAGPVIYVNYITKVYVQMFLFKQIIICNEKNYKVPSYKLFFVLIGSIMSISGSLDIFMIVAALIIMIKTDLFYNNLSKHSFSFSFLFLLLSFGVPFIGIANKVGFEQGFILLQENYLFTFKSIISRIGTWHQSTNVYLTILKSEIIYNPSDVIFDIIATVINRIEILFGGVKDIPKIQSIKRLNYLNLFKYNSNPKTGASPGIVATSVIFYFPIGFVLFSFFLGQYYRYLYKVILKKTNILTDVFILMSFVLPIVSSPIDLINFISPSFSFIIFLIALKHNIKALRFKNEIYIFNSSQNIK